MKKEWVQMAYTIAVHDVRIYAEGQITSKLISQCFQHTKETSGFVLYD